MLSEQTVIMKSQDQTLIFLQVRPVNAVVSYDSGEGKEGKGIQSPHIEPQVQYICFSADGTRMATVDVRPDISQPDSVYHSNLRFWESRGSGTPQEDAPLYQVHQDIDSPHRLHPDSYLICLRSQCQVHKATMHNFEHPLLNLLLPGGGKRRRNNISYCQVEYFVHELAKVWRLQGATDRPSLLPFL